MERVADWIPAFETSVSHLEQWRDLSDLQQLMSRLTTLSWKTLPRARSGCLDFLEQRTKSISILLILHSPWQDSEQLPQHSRAQFLNTLKIQDYPMLTVWVTVPVSKSIIPLHLWHASAACPTVNLFRPGSRDRDVAVWLAGKSDGVFWLVRAQYLLVTVRTLMEVLVISFAR